MSKGMVFTMAMVQELGKKARLFSGKDILISNSIVYRIREDASQRKKVIVEPEAVALQEIFSEIKRVYDCSNTLIAERLNHNCRLLSTGKGSAKISNVKNSSNLWIR